MEVRVAYYRQAAGKRGHNFLGTRDLREVFRLDERLQVRANEMLAEHGKDSATYREFKARRIPAVQASSTALANSDIEAAAAHSAFVMVDLDGLGREEYEAFRAMLADDEHAFLYGRVA